MTLAEFEAALEVFEQISERAFRNYRGKRRAELAEALGRLKQLVGPDGMPYAQVQAGVLDRKRQRTVKFGWIDVSYCDDGELLVLGHDSTPRPFLMDGTMVTLPEDQCPKCLGDWKIDPRVLQPCPGCGAELGSELTLVAEDERCPICETDRGSSTICESCGLDWDADYVARR